MSNSTAAKRAIWWSVAVAPFALLSAAVASDWDGSRPLICAAIDLYSCAPENGCEKETPESLNAPQFLNIDFEKKVINAKRPNGEAKSTQIETFRKLDDRVILGGVEGRLSWNIAIASANGKMILSAATPDPEDPLGITIFGACTHQ